MACKLWSLKPQADNQQQVHSRAGDLKWMIQWLENHGAGSVGQVGRRPGEERPRVGSSAAAVDHRWVRWDWQNHCGRAGRQNTAAEWASEGEVNTGIGFISAGASTGKVRASINWALLCSKQRPHLPSYRKGDCLSLLDLNGSFKGHVYVW